MIKYKLEMINCPLCGSKDHEIFLERVKELYIGLDEYFNIVQCNQCGFMYTNPRPREEDMDFFYPDNAGYYQIASPGFVFKDSLKYRIFSSILTNHMSYNFAAAFSKKVTQYFYCIPFVRKQIDLMHIPEFIKSGRLLDIGCSWGNYLFRMRELGWHVFGIEMNEKAVGFARKELGMNHVIQGKIEDVLPYKDEFFDVINMSMVLEHLYYPKQTLKEVHRILKSSGKIIISVPDISGFEAALYKDKCYMLHIPQHLNHFTSDTIKDLLTKSGFEVQKIVHHKFDRDMVSSANYINRPYIARILHSVWVRKTLVKIFVNFLSMIGKTSRMTIFVRKKNG